MENKSSRSSPLREAGGTLADILENTKMKIEDQFDYFKKQTGIQIPQNVVENYLNNKNNNSEFIRLFKYQVDSVEKGHYPELSILISEKFAKEILTLIHEYSYSERITNLFQEIFDYNNYNKELKIETNIEEFVIEEILYSVIDYNYIENKFKFPLIQKAYENIGSKTEELKVILILWTHCGGEGGIIVRGRNIGFDSGYAHGDFSVVNFKDKKYEYSGFLFEEDEKIHKPILEKNL